jgi:hypothetical protein
MGWSTAAKVGLNGSPERVLSTSLIAGDHRLPDKSAILRIRHLFENHRLVGPILATVNQLLGAGDLRVYTTLIPAWFNPDVALPAKPTRWTRPTACFTSQRRMNLLTAFSPDHGEVAHAACTGQPVDGAKALERVPTMSAPGVLELDANTLNTPDGKTARRHTDHVSPNKQGQRSFIQPCQSSIPFRQ